MNEGFDVESSTRWSPQIHKEKGFFPEFERTILSIVILYLLLDGSEDSYNYFTSPQDSSQKLSRANFDKLHIFAKSTVGVDPTVIEVNLLLDDMGSTQKARSEAQKYGITEADHHFFMTACLKDCPLIFPSFNNLSTEAKQLIQNKFRTDPFWTCCPCGGGS